MENDNKTREMTQEELDRIVGGYLPNRLGAQREQHTPGIRCPICGTMIPISIQQLLYAAALHCPACGLTLFIDKKRVEKAQEALAKMDEAKRQAGL